MSNDYTTGTANAIGDSLGDIVVGFLLIVKVLRLQPGFNNDMFSHEIDVLLERDGLSPTQRSILTSLL